jgi:hypothetical protein
MVVAIPEGAQAHDWDHHRYDRHRGPEFFFNFRTAPYPYAYDPFAYDRWSAGSWVEGWYGGQYGWWWVSGGRRYWYERPLYPYPTYPSRLWYPETVIMQEPPPVVVQQPPAIVVQQPPPVLIQPQAQSAPQSVQPQQNSQTWYYCDKPAGYYPYVQTCTVPFRAVPAQSQ